MVVFMGALVLGVAIGYTPDITNAKIAADRIFSILDKVPSIDVASSEGKTVVSLLLIPYHIFQMHGEFSKSMSFWCLHYITRINIFSL